MRDIVSPLLFNIMDDIKTSKNKNSGSYLLPIGIYKTVCHCGQLGNLWGNQTRNLEECRDIKQRFIDEKTKSQRREILGNDNWKNKSQH